MCTRDKLGRQAVHLAAQAGCQESLEYLFTHHQIDPSISTEGSGMAPLHLAAKVCDINDRGRSIV